MRKRSLRSLLALAWLTSAVMLSGCWDIIDPQDVNYFMALGFDYEDGKFVVYAQMVDFASVTTPESDKPTQHMPVLVGTGRGVTAARAYNDLYDTAQRRVIYGHVGAIVFSENMMKHGLQNIFDLLSRYQELRYTPWVYGTKEKVEEILSISPFFNLSPLTSLLHQPLEIYRQKSYVPPLMMREFVANIREPGKTAILPAIDINGDSWKEDLRPKEMLEINGIFTFDSNRYNSFLSTEDITGLRFVTPTTERTPIDIRVDDKVYSEVSVTKPKVKITPRIEGDTVKFHMSVTMKGLVIEVIEPISEQEMEKLASEEVKKEIITTYERALEKNIDLYQLEHQVYVKHNKWWKEHVRDRDFHLDKDSLEVEVKVDIQSSGKLKLIAE
jgi:Ger(x)C family germination protein